MIVDKVTPIIHKTSELLNLPLDIVAEVVKHQFTSIKEHLLNPHPKALLAIENLGKIRGRLNAVNLEILRLIPKLRADPSLAEEFRYYWNLRQSIIKENSLRNYKQRFGKWHHK